MARVRESYSSRISRLMGQGFSRSQARGHARTFEPKVVEARATARRLGIGEREVARGRSLFKEFGKPTIERFKFAATTHFSYDVPKSTFLRDPDFDRKALQQLGRHQTSFVKIQFSDGTYWQTNRKVRPSLALSDLRAFIARYGDVAIDTITLVGIDA